MNAPHIVQPITALNEGDGEPPAEVNESTPLEEQPRGWWYFDDNAGAKTEGTRVIAGWDKSVSYLSEQLQEHGPFDAILGFSQGGCLAAALTSAFEDVSRWPGLKLHPDQKAAKFTVIISGFKNGEPQFEALYKQKVHTPLLLIVGKQDPIVAPSRSMSLLDYAEDVRLEEHPGGHGTPTQGPWRNFFKDVFAAFARPDGPGDWHAIPGPNDRAPGPSPAGSKPTSGTTTPSKPTTLHDLEQAEKTTKE